MKQIRHSVFETNSSSTHSITFYRDKEHLISDFVYHLPIDGEDELEFEKACKVKDDEKIGLFKPKTMYDNRCVGLKGKLKCIITDTFLHYGCVSNFKIVKETIQKLICLVNVRKHLDIKFDWNKYENWSDEDWYKWKDEYTDGNWQPIINLNKVKDGEWIEDIDEEISELQGC